MTDPVIARKSPYEIGLKGTYRYSWCARGLGNCQMFRDGSHRKLD